mgnify:CR=1 FL=1
MATQKTRPIDDMKDEKAEDPDAAFVTGLAESEDDKDAEPLTVLVKRYVEFNTEKKKADAEAKRWSAKMTEIEGAILEGFADDCVQSLNVAGHNVHLRTYQSVKAKGGVANQDLAEALKKAKLGEFVTANLTSLRAYAKERVEDGKAPFPPSIEALVDVNEVTKIGVRKS